MIERAGRLLYGEQFKPQLARALNLDLRTLRRWAASGYCPDDKAEALYRMLTERRAAIATLQHELMHLLYPEERTP